MAIQQFGNAFKAKITNEERRTALGVIGDIPNFFDNTHDYVEGQSAVIDALWNGGNLTRANLRSKLGAGEYEDWRRGGPVDDAQAGDLIGQIYDIGWNDVDFLVERESNDIRVIDPLTGMVVGGIVNILALESKVFRWWKMAIKGEEKSIWEKAFTDTITRNDSNSLMWPGFSGIGEESSINLTPTNIKVLLDNEWETKDIIGDGIGQLQANVNEIDEKEVCEYDQKQECQQTNIEQLPKQ